uniref:Uncharacterized protein n=1 Tax=Meloidogyne hapla TaxID=6305 RepID=A0A1I8BW81_MELHA
MPTTPCKTGEITTFEIENAGSTTGENYHEPRVKKTKHPRDVKKERGSSSTSFKTHPDDRKNIKPERNQGHQDNRYKYSLPPTPQQIESPQVNLPSNHPEGHQGTTYKYTLPPTPQDNERNDEKKDKCFCNIM